MKKKKSKNQTNFIDKLNETKKSFITAKKNTLSRFFIIKQNARLKKILLSGVIFLASLLALFFLNLIYENVYSDKFFIGVSLVGENLGGKNFNEALIIITKKIENFKEEGLIISYKDKKTRLPAEIVGDTPDIYIDLFAFNPQSDLVVAYKTGREADFFHRLSSRLNALLTGYDLKMAPEINEKKINEILQDNFSKFENPAKNAELIFSSNEILISRESHGRVFDYNSITKTIKQKLTNLDQRELIINLKTDYPEIYKEQADSLVKNAKEALKIAPIKITAHENKKKKIQKNEWIIDQKKIREFLEVKKNAFQYDAGWFSRPELKEEFYIGLNEEKFKEYFKEKISTFIDIEPTNAKFEIKNGKVTEFESSHNGQEADFPNTFKKLEGIIKKASRGEEIKNKIIALNIKEVKSKIKNENVNNLGIKELIGVGHSNFAGSSWSRRHNISTGALAAHGTLIKPGEEFSMNKTLGEINAKTGYLPEMVIKGNETIPEYGGGLCQVGTTMFRAALDSGLPITERRNHSYRVRYYEPAGTDATIYGPHPDLRFINDTENYILIQKKIEDNNIYFEIWGTNDGRTASTTDPIIYNITAPPPTKLIETEELKPGEKKCTEHAIYGADAYFDYTVIYPNGEKKEERFKSRYQPWQEVCLIGMEEKTASSTLNISEAVTDKE